MANEALPDKSPSGPGTSELADSKSANEPSRVSCAQSPVQVTRLPELKGHQKSVLCLAFLPDLSCAISASEDRTALIWDLNEQKPVHSIVPPKRFFHSCATEPDKTSPSTAAAVQEEEGQSVYQMDISFVAFLSSSRCCVALGGHLLVYDFSSAPATMEEPTLLLRVSNEEINHLSIDHTGKYLTAADDDGQVHIVDLQRFKLARTIKAHQAPCMCVTFRPSNNQELISGGLDCRIVHINHSNASVLFTFDFAKTLAGSSQIANPPYVHSVSFTPDGEFLVAALGNGTVEFFALDFRLQLTPISHAHNSAVTQVLVPDASPRSLVSVCLDKTISFWTVQWPEPSVLKQLSAAGSKTQLQRSKKTRNARCKPSCPPAPSSARPLCRLQFRIKCQEKINWALLTPRSHLYIADLSDRIRHYEIPTLTTDFATPRNLNEFTP